MKIALLGDTHFGARGDSLHFHDHFKKFFDDVFFPYCLKNNITTVVQFGDLFDRRKFVNFNTLHLSKQYFFDKLLQNNMHMHVLLGNHCVYFKNTPDLNSPELLLKEYSNITLYDKFTQVEFGGLAIDIVPWVFDSKVEIEKMSNSKSKICFGHFDIAGFEMDRGNISHDGFDSNVFSKYYHVYSGHFHHKSTKSNISYLGTPYEITWSDFNDPRGFHIFDTDTLDIEFVQNSFTLFHKIYYDDSTQTLDYWKNFDYSKYEDVYVKVVVLNKTDEYQFDYAMDNLYKAVPADLNIVEDFIELSSLHDDDVDQSEDTMTILSNYVDQLTVDVNSDKLKGLLRKLYVESLEMECN